MLCPYCSNEMTQGYIQCRDGVHWTPKKSMVPAFSGLKKGAVLLNNDPYSNSSVSIAYLCRKCKRIVIELKHL